MVPFFHTSSATQLFNQRTAPVDSEGLFTVRKSPGVLDYGCVNLERSYEDSYITVQAF